MSEDRKFAKVGDLRPEQVAAAAGVCCMKVEDKPPEQVLTPGTLVEECAGCGVEIYVSPNSPKTVPHVCTSCALMAVDMGMAQFGLLPSKKDMH